MIVSDLRIEDLAERLAGPGLLLRSGPLVMRLGTSLKELAEPLGLLYGDYAVMDEGGIVDFHVRVDPFGGLRRLLTRPAVTYVDGYRAFAPFKRRLALPMLEWGVNWCVFTRPNQYLLLHSAVVERGGRALLLSGKPGAGKSTLTAALVLRGWRLLSDEVGMIPPGTNRLLPVPRPVGLKDESIDIIRDFGPSAVIGPECAGTRKGTVAHMRPPRESVVRGDEPATAAWIVFPRYEAGAPVELIPVGKADALLRVGDEAFNYSLLGEVGFETLADVVERCECFEYRYGDLEQAVTVLNDLAAGSDAPPMRPPGAGSPERDG